jgi:uncharacterized protein (TIGR02594 family)
MVEFSTFRRSLHVAALALSSAAFAVSATPASARSHHGAGHSARAHHVGRFAGRNFHHGHYRHFAQRHYGHFARTSRGERSVALIQGRGFAGIQASFATSARSSFSSPETAGAMTTSSGLSSSSLVSEARRYLGGNPTGRGSLWCARFMNMVLEHTGHHGTGSDMANSFAHYGQRISGPQVGAIAVMGRRGGGHVGIITGIDAQGNPIMISGNNGNRVREAPISRGRIYAYVMPTN